MANFWVNQVRIFRGGRGHAKQATVDMEGITAHEFGHALGLHHTNGANDSTSSRSQFLMGVNWPTGNTTCSTFPQSYDIQGMNEAYE